MPKKRIKRKAPETAQPSEDSVGTITHTDFIAVPPPLKLCRLCESKDGPFLNIFEADKVTARKIEDLMPFGVAENDELPHKICFRCSAKVEELHEFIQKTIKTQINLRTALGKTEPFTTISKSRWEERLNQSKVSNDDICDAVIQKAMNGIPVSSVSLDNCKDAVDSDLSAGKPGTVTGRKISSVSLLSENANLRESSDEQDAVIIVSDDNADDVQQPHEKPDRLSEDNSKAKKPTIQKKGVKSIKQAKMTLRSKVDKVTNGGELPIEQKTTTKRRTSDSIASFNPKNIPKRRKSETTLADSDKNSNLAAETNTANKTTAKNKQKNKNTHQSDLKVSGQSTSNKQAIDEEPFEIMDNVEFIRINGVGILYQCKICNRNFLNKDVVQFHGCSKNRIVSKNEVITKPNNPEPPKPSTVKYIDTRMGNDSKKVATLETFSCNDKTSTDLKTSSVTQGSQVKPKPKIGPASKVKRDTEESTTLLVGSKNGSEASSGKKQSVTTGPLNLAPTPNLNCPYKLVRGPNNTYILVEEPVPPEIGLEKHKQQSVNDSNITVGNSNCLLFGSKQTEATKHTVDKQPYPVGLIQTVPKFPPQSSAPHTITSGAFVLTDAQEQSCSLIQTEHPNKFIISPKPQPSADESVKKIRKKSAVGNSNCLLLGSKQTETTKQTVDKQPYPVGLIQNVPKFPPRSSAPHTITSGTFASTEAQKQSCFIQNEQQIIRKTKMASSKQKSKSANPFSVTVDDTSITSDMNEMFSFLNVDPLLTPAYVLPVTDASQSVANINDRPDSVTHLLATGNKSYTCYLCNKLFTREQKLLAHIHSQHNMMDEEDQVRVTKTIQKRGKKS